VGRDEIRRVATTVRKMVELDAMDLDIADDLSTLEGACKYASYALSKMLPGSVYTYGRYLANGERHGHAWVEVDDVIVDITATQFDAEVAVTIVEKASRRYVKYVEGAAAEAFLDYPDEWLKKWVAMSAMRREAENSVA